MPRRPIAAREVVAQLERQLLALLKERAPAAPEETEYRDALTVWTAKAQGEVARESARLLRFEGHVAAQRYIDAFNATRPVRRRGRPTQVLPRLATARHALYTELAAAYVAATTEDSIHALLDRVAAALIGPPPAPRSTTAAARASPARAPAPRFRSRY